MYQQIYTIMEHQQSKHSRWQHWQLPHGCCKSVIGGCEGIILLFVLLISGVTGVKADGYVTDVMVYGKKDTPNPSMSGWSRLTKNLNAGTGEDTWDIFLFYKTSTDADPRRAILPTLLLPPISRVDLSRTAGNIP